jgi:hypothetical protein
VKIGECGNCKMEGATWRGGERANGSPK